MIAATMSAEIGYGNAAGFLFLKGITEPPSGKITEMDNIDSDPTIAQAPSRQTGNANVDNNAGARHPITSLENTRAAEAARELASMSQEEKEREAERLFVLFQRMKRNPVLSLGAEVGTSGAEGVGGGSQGKVVGVEQMMREKLNSGEHAEMDEREEREEREKREKEEREDEEEAGREMAAYRARRGR